jgi:hypothetical protein
VPARLAQAVIPDSVVGVDGGEEHLEAGGNRKSNGFRSSRDRVHTDRSGYNAQSTINAPHRIPVQLRNVRGSGPK